MAVPSFVLSEQAQNSLEQLGRYQWLLSNMVLPDSEIRLLGEVQAKRAEQQDETESEDDVSTVVGQARGRDRVQDFVDFAGSSSIIRPDSATLAVLNWQIVTSADGVGGGLLRDESASRGRYSGPEPEHVYGLVHELMSWIDGSSEEGPVVAGLASVQLLAVLPFRSANLQTALAFADVIMKKAGYPLNDLVSVETCLDGAEVEMSSALSAVLGGSYQDGYDASRWIEYFLEAMSTGMRDHLSTLSEWHQMMRSAYDMLQPMGFEGRHVEGWILARLSGEISKPDYMALSGVSSATATRDLSMLVRAGYLRGVGQTRSRRYRPATG